MPNSPRRSQRVPRCSYSEGNRRCQFSGSGNPPLCRAHRMIVAEAAAPQVRRPVGHAVGELFSQFFSGQQVTRDDLERTLHREMWAMGGHIAENYHPHVDDGREQDEDDVDFDPNGQPHQQPPPNGQPPPGWQSRWSRSEPPPPPPEEQLKQQAARQVLGFAPQEPITVATLRARHRVLVKKYHPDQFPDPAKKRTAEARLRDINASVDILMETIQP